MKQPVRRKESELSWKDFCVKAEVRVRLEAAPCHCHAHQDFFRTLVWVDWLGFHPVGAMERLQHRARALGEEQLRPSGLGFDRVGRSRLKGRKQKGDEPASGRCWKTSMVEVAGVNQSRRRAGQEGQPAADVVTGGFWMWPGSGRLMEKEVKRQLLAGCA